MTVRVMVLLHGVDVWYLHSIWLRMQSSSALASTQYFQCLLTTIYYWCTRSMHNRTSRCQGSGQ
jgi:hypothetical protein